MLPMAEALAENRRSARAEALLPEDRIARATPELNRDESQAGFSTLVNNICVFPQVRGLVPPAGIEPATRPAQG